MCSPGKKRQIHTNVNWWDSQRSCLTFYWTPGSTHVSYMSSYSRVYLGSAGQGRSTTIWHFQYYRTLPLSKVGQHLTLSILSDTLIVQQTWKLCSLDGVTVQWVIIFSQLRCQKTIENFNKTIEIVFLQGKEFTLLSFFIVLNFSNNHQSLTIIMAHFPSWMSPLYCCQHLNI